MFPQISSKGGETLGPNQGKPCSVSYPCSDTHTCFQHVIRPK